MQGPKQIQKFCRRYPRVGPVLYVASIQFFITQLVVALFWPARYSLGMNTISDLGNSACGIYGERYVCSPLFSWMNASFMVLGLTMLAGSTLLYYQFPKKLGNSVGFSLMALAGIGTVLVGLFPENTVSVLHSFGAFLPFFFGNIALLVLGLSLDLTPRFRFYTIFSGVISLSAFILLLSHTYLGIGLGGMERFTAHPQTIWLIVFGAYLSRNQYRALKARQKAKAPSLVI